MSWLHAKTLCRIGIHCRPVKRVEKFNGGNGAALCCHCRLIVRWGHP
jgi:hypothetical protein